MGIVNEPDDQFTEGRRKLPKRRTLRTFKVKINGKSFFMGVSYYPDNKPGEVFIDNMKTGTDINDLMKAMAKLVSLALQYGCPYSKIIKALKDFKEGGLPRAVSDLLVEATDPEVFNDPYKGIENPNESVENPVVPNPPPLPEKVACRGSAKKSRA